MASTTLTTLEWKNSVLIDGDLPTEVQRLKAEDGPQLEVPGSSSLIQTLLAHDLIDEFRLWVFPVVVGPGKRLFGEGTRPSGLTLVDTKTSTTGVTIATYRPAGEIPSGSFAFEAPTEAELRRRESMEADSPER